MAKASKSQGFASGVPFNALIVKLTGDKNVYVIPNGALQQFRFPVRNSAGFNAALKKIDHEGIDFSAYKPGFVTMSSA
jgi:hypothetical protein